MLTSSPPPSHTHIHALNSRSLGGDIGGGAQVGARKKFSKVSALLNLPCQSTTELTFENSVWEQVQEEKAPKNKKEGEGCVGEHL